MKKKEIQKSTREYKVYIHSTKEWITVTEDVYRAYYRDIRATRNRAQSHGQCMCPKSKTCCAMAIALPVSSVPLEITSPRLQHRR